MNKQNIPNTIGKFKRYTKKPSSMKYGTYYVQTIKLPFSKEKRALRVWLPEDYEFDNPSKRFPVLYMSDGQNLVDKYLTAYGDWGLDKVIHQLHTKEKLSTCILVGIDCPHKPGERSSELNPPFECDEKTRYLPKNPYGNLISDYFVEVVKPEIDELFFTRPEKEFTGVGGSSMGGIFAFYSYFYHHETFGFSLTFSPAFMFYKKKTWLNIVESLNIDNQRDGKLFMYVGGKDFESVFVERTFDTYNYLKDEGYTPEHLAIIHDSNEIHHAAAWHTYSLPALRFWLKDIK